MFPPQRYATAAVSREIPLAVQLFLWQCIDALPFSPDYLQVFELSPALKNKLSELEETKEKLLFELNDVESSLVHDEFSEEKIRKLFSKAEQQLKNGTLANRRMLIDQYIDKVVIYKDCIKVYMNLVSDYTVKEVIEQ